MMHRRRRGNRGRRPSPLYVSHKSATKEFIPHPEGAQEPVSLEPAELEVLRLIDLLNLSQEEAGEKMGTSRGTIWRLLQSARLKVTSALIEGRKIVLL